MSFATMPEVIGFVAQRLSTVTKSFTPSSVNSDGLPGMVPAPTAGAAIKCLTSTEGWMTLNTTNISPKAFSAWAPGVEYDIPGIFLYFQERMFFVKAPHTSVQIDADIIDGNLIEITGTELAGSAWVAGSIYTEKQVAVFNGQLVQSTMSHVSTTFANDCINGLWKFVANTQISSIPTGTNFYSFTGHVVLKNNQLWTCITPHVASSWVQSSWLCLTSTFTGASSNSDGTTGNVPAPTSGQHQHVLTGDGVWSDLVALLNSLGYSPGGTVVASDGYVVNTTAIVGPTTITLNSTHKNKITPVNTVAGVVTLSMPAGAVPGDHYILVDAANSWSTNPVNITSSLMHGTVQTASLDLSGSTVTFTWIDSSTGWVLLID